MRAANMTQSNSAANSKAKRHALTSKPCFFETKRKASSTFEQSIDARNRTLNIEPLKSFVSQNFPKNCPLRIVLAAERSSLTVPEFLSKMETWAYLLRSV
jgi:hypothetical protein